MFSMFTGLVEEMGTVHQVLRKESRRQGLSMHLVIKAALVSQDTKVGDSIAVNGCCLTVVNKDRHFLEFDAGRETLSRTNLDRLTKGSRVNLERSLKVGDRLGGHFVSGHIDGPATLVKRRDEGEWSHFTFRTARLLTQQMACKGSVAVEGVSLTIVTVDEDKFSVALIPHTLRQTTLGKLSVGDVVNVETDLLAKYVQRHLQGAADRDAFERAFTPTRP